MSIICEVCGAENMEGSIYCEDCGARLPGAAATPAPAAAAPAPAPAPAPTPPAPAPAPEPVSEPEPQPQPTAEVPPEENPMAAPSGPVTCDACGAENPAGEAYCEDCGAALPGTAGASPPPAVSIPDTPPPVQAPPPVAVAEPVATGAPTPASGSRLALADGSGDFPLDKDVINIGRRSPVDGIFPEVDLTEADVDSYISRRHGKIVFGEQGPVYEDLGSSNGSFLNGTRLSHGVQTPIKPGDQLRLGKTEMVYQVG